MTAIAELKRAASEGLVVVFADDYSEFRGIAQRYHEPSDTLFLRGVGNKTTIPIANALEYPEFITVEPTAVEFFHGLKVGTWFTLESTGPLRYVKLNDDEFFATTSGNKYSVGAIELTETIVVVNP